MKKNLPFAFNCLMVRALLRGDKTVTRRLVKYNPDGEKLPPKAGVGDVIWVREAWRAPFSVNRMIPSQLPADCPVKFEADGGILNSWPLGKVCPYSFEWGRFRHQNYLPQQFSRIELGVLKVWDEPLEAITEADAKAEGVRIGEAYCIATKESETYREAFFQLWDSIYGFDQSKQGVAQNPLVWRYEFEILSIKETKSK